MNYYNDNALRCKSYEILREAGSPVFVSVKFILPIGYHESERIAEALKQIELLLSAKEGINFLKNSGGFVCAYCGTRHKSNIGICGNCGGKIV